jgi:hypothetical protein
MSGPAKDACHDARLPLAFRDWCGDFTHFPRELAEAALAHTLDSKTETAYRRSSALAKRSRVDGRMGLVLHVR